MSKSGTKSTKKQVFAELAVLTKAARAELRSLAAEMGVPYPVVARRFRKELLASCSGGASGA